MRKGPNSLPFRRKTPLTLGPQAPQASGEGASVIPGVVLAAVVPGAPAGSGAFQPRAGDLGGLAAELETRRNICRVLHTLGRERTIAGTHSKTYSQEGDVKDRISSLTTRIEHLERSLDRWRRVAACLAAIALTIVLGGAGFQDPQDQTTDLVRTRRVEVVDSEGRLRLVLGEEAGAERQVAIAGVFLIDEAGDERGGFGTTNENSALLALDAPPGVGAPMRDRLGLIVNSDGSAEVRLISNDTLVPVRLISPAKDAGGIEFLRHLPAEKIVRVKKLGFDGESTYDLKLGGGK